MNQLQKNSVTNVVYYNILVEKIVIGGGHGT